MTKPWVMIHLVRPDATVMESYRINEDDLENSGRLSGDIIADIERRVQREVIVDEFDSLPKCMVCGLPADGICEATDASPSGPRCFDCASSTAGAFNRFTSPEEGGGVG